MGQKVTTGSILREIRRRTRKKYTAEKKIRIVLEGIRGEGRARGFGENLKKSDEMLGGEIQAYIPAVLKLYNVHYQTKFINNERKDKNP